MDILSVKEISVNLNVDANVLIFDSLESTNITAKDLAVKGKPHGTVLIANGLTAARGRRGRSFYAPKGAGIYMSIILRPDKNAANLPELITILAAVSVCEAIEKVCGRLPKVKWINDIFLNDKKICGILAEAVMDNNYELQSIILGIGINFVEAQVPDELKDIVGSIFTKGENVIATRNQLIAEVLNNVLTSNEWTKTLESYKKRLFMLGRKVRVESSEPYVATAIDVDERGRLLVCDLDGEVHTLDSGEISVKM